MIVVIVTLRSPFGWEASVDHLGRGFFQLMTKSSFSEGLSSTPEVLMVSSDGNSLPITGPP